MVGRRNWCARNESSASAGRVVALDGLRGIAALVVAFHHQFLTVPALANQYSQPGQARVGSLVWWLTYTPLHLLWDGTEAVFLFFVLSGYVLALPVREGRAVSWWAGYYARRLLRLYLPVVACLAVAVVVISLVPRRVRSGQSWWTAGHATMPHGLKTAFHDALLSSSNGWVNTALWSLHFEVLFSLLLPVYIVCARRVRRGFAIEVAGLLAVVFVGGYRGSLALLYLPMFGVGVLLAMQRERLASWGSTLRRDAGLLVVLVSLLLLNMRWAFAVIAVPGLSLRAEASLGNTCVVAGAGLAVFLMSAWSPAIRVGGRRTMQSLGRRRSVST